MDVVYVVREGERNEELRYSLRSLVNLPHDRVWIAGHKPSWTKCLGIPNKQRLGKWANTLSNLLAACRHPDVSDDFIFFNDDFFVVQPLTDLPVTHRGRCSQIKKRGRRYAAYESIMASTVRLCGVDDPLIYDLHTPMAMNKQRVIDIANGLKSVHIKTLYGNTYRVGGMQMGNVKRTGMSDPIPDGPFASTDDRSFRHGLIGEQLRAMFPEPSRHE